ncbi:hypothetical protein J0H58_38115, partial [bacterium]|nr:hypothetical protein [bacterium]
MPNSYLLNPPAQPRGPRTSLPAPIPFKDDVYDPRTVNPYAPLPTPPGGMHPAARVARRPGETADDYAYRVYSGDRPSTYRMTPPRVRAESVPNVAPAMPSFGAADVASMRTSAAVDARGGAKMVSSQTALEIQQKEHLRVEQELTKAIERQLRALYPAISATEARRMAEERARTALDRNEAVLRNSTGGVVGTAALGQQLQDAGKNPAGVTGWLGGGTFRERAATLGGRLARSFTPQGGMVGTYGLMMGAPMLGELVGPSQRSVQVAATTGNTFGAQ